MSDVVEAVVYFPRQVYIDRRKEIEKIMDWVENNNPPEDTKIIDFNCEVNYGGHAEIVDLSKAKIDCLIQHNAGSEYQSGLYLCFRGQHAGVDIAFNGDLYAKVTIGKDGKPRVDKQHLNWIKKFRQLAILFNKKHGHISWFTSFGIPDPRKSLNA